MDLTRLPRPFARPGAPWRGRPPALPPLLDRLSRAWWQLGPRLRWALVTAGVVGLLALAGRGASTSAFGPPVEVLVASRDLTAGTVLDGAAVTRRTWPADLVPDDAITSPDGRRLRGPAVAGQVLVERHLAGGLAGLVAPGHAAVAVPVDGLPDVAPGDLVDVVAATPDGRGQRAASGVEVLAVESGWLWLGVPDSAVDLVAASGAAGRLSLGVRPGGD